MSSEGATVAEGLHAFCTSVWSLPCMDPNMYGEGGSLDEFLSTFITLVWSVQSQQNVVMQWEYNLKPECIRSGQGDWLDL